MSNTAWDIATGVTPWYRDCTPAAPPLALTGVAPSSGSQGANVSVSITGTGLNSSTTFSFGNGVSVADVAITSDTLATATLQIAANAAVGARTITATRSSDSSSASLPNAFTVTAPTSGAVVLSAMASTPGPVGVGDGVSYTLSITNSTSAALTGLTVSARLPAGLALRPGNCDAGASNGVVTWPIGGLGVGASANCVLGTEVTALPAGCSRDCTLTVSVSAQYTGGQTTTEALVGTLVPPKVETVTASGAPATRDSIKPSLSGSGDLLVFSSKEKDLVAESNPNPGSSDIYLRDRRTGQTRLISRDANGRPLSGEHRDVKVSLNGRMVAFVSNPAARRGEAKAGGFSQLCVAPPDGQFRTLCTSKGVSGAALDGGVQSPSPSADGKRVAFCSEASNWVVGDTNNARDVFVREADGTVRRVSVTANGEQGNGDSCDPALSGNGRYVVFTTRATNLGGTANRAQVVRKDLQIGELIRLSQSDNGPGDAEATQPSISSDGQRVVFTSRSRNLAPTAASGRNQVFLYDGRGGAQDALNAPIGKTGQAGRAIAKAAQNGNLTVLLTQNGQPPNGDARDAQLSCDGEAIGVTTQASNIVPGDTNGVSDVFLYRYKGASVSWPGPQGGGQIPNGPSQGAALDCEATTGAWDSTATNTGNPNPNADVLAQDDPARNAPAAGVLDASYSGNWFNPGQSGHGFLLEALADTDAFYATWYVFDPQGRPVFLQGVGTPQGNRLTMDLVSARSTGFPVGAAPQGTLWGQITFEFTSGSDGTATWQPIAPGYRAGSMNLRRLSRAALTEGDRDGQLGACVSGIWYDPARSGYGFDLEMNDLDTGDRVLQVFWFTYQPDGSPLWLGGSGVVGANSVSVDLVQIGGAGALFPPAYSRDRVSLTPWGKVTLRFTGTNRLDVDYASTRTGYGSGTLKNLQPLTVLAGRECR